MRMSMLVSLKSIAIRKPDKRVFFFGLEGSGKTTILYKLQKMVMGIPNFEATTIKPISNATVTLFILPAACNYEIIPHKEVTLHVLDVRGIHAKCLVL
jgi:hypothetical protein